MKTNVLFGAFLAITCMTSGMLNAQLSFTSGATVVIDFENTVAGINNDTYDGSGLASVPGMGQLDSDGITVTGISNLAGGSRPEFGNPPTDALFAVDAFMSTDNWFALNPNGDWSIVLQIDNNIAATSIYNLEIGFDARIRNSDANDQVYALEYAFNSGGPWTQVGQPLSLPPGSPTLTNWVPFSFNTGALCIGEITTGNSIFLRLSGTGTGSDEIAFNSVTITPQTIPVCTLTNITSFTTANVEDVTLDLNWMENGSGDCAETYYVVGREGVAPAADLLVNNLRGLYDASSFNASSDWSMRSDATEVWTQTGFTLGADEVDYFVYNGTGTSVSITGLSENTNYNFLIMATGEKCAWLVGSNVNTTTLLPIELISFTGEARENDVLLKWRTQTEINNDYMVVERSEDGVDFHEIGRVQGAGNSQVPQQYSFIDVAPLWGTNYYRLKQVDFDGTPTYYHIITVLFEAELISWQISPSLVTDQILVNTNKAFEPGSFLQLIDLNGRVLKTVNSDAGAFRQSLDVSGLVSGTYFLRLNRQGRVSLKRFIKK